MEESTVSTESVVPAKPKKILTPEQLEKLKLAREKAVEVRKKLGDIKRREKGLKGDLLNKRIKELEIKEASVRAPKRQEKESSDESSSESSEDEAPIAPPKRQDTPKPVRRKAQEKVKKLSNNELATAIARDEYRQRILNETYRQAFSSLFPNHMHNPYG